MSAAWINARERLPSNSQQVLCVLRMNDQGEYASWQRVLYYNREEWWSPDPPEHEAISPWHEVVWWRPLDWPSEAGAMR